jgi:hypothetical protein
MHDMTSAPTWLPGLASRRLRLTLFAALAGLALAAGPARADLVVYDFTGTGIDAGTQSKVTITGSFAVDRNDFDIFKGHFTPAQLQAPSFTVSDGFAFDQFAPLSVLTAVTGSGSTLYDVRGANLTLTSPSSPGTLLQITGSSTTGFAWDVLENNQQQATGSGTFTHHTVPTPAPSALTLFGLGGLCLAGYAWRRRQLAVA